MSKSIQSGKKTFHNGAADSMPVALKMGEVKSFRDGLNAYLAKRGLNRHPYKRTTTGTVDTQRAGWCCGESKMESK